MHQNKDEVRPKFKVPYISAQWIMPLLTLGIFIWLWLTKDSDGSYAYDLIHKEELMHQIPTWIFYISLIVLSVLSFTKKLSLIPMLGLLFCLYFLSTLGAINWIRFLIWLANRYCDLLYLRAAKK